MTRIKKFAVAAVAALTIATAFAPAAEAAGGRRTALGLGLLGGAILGASMAHGAGYGYHGGYGYARPVYYGGGYGGCVRRTVGHTWDGYPIRRTVCY